MTVKLSSDGSTLVDLNYTFQKIDEKTPRGVAMLLIHEDYGVLHKGVLTKSNETVYTHYAPCPSFRKD